MTSEAKNRSYVKKIIEEYNVLLQSWGHSDTWDLSQFKTLEDMIFETAKVNVNANTLKRFFRLRTEAPQLATKDALCKFLGYAGYTDFVIKKTKQEEQAAYNTPNPLPSGAEEIAGAGKPKELPYPPDKKGNKSYIYLIVAAAVIVLGYFLYTYNLRDLYIRYLVSTIDFSASRVKGSCPLTVTFAYKIPSRLFDDITIVYQDANGDEKEKKLNREAKQVNETYIFEGEAFCYLKYKGDIIKTIHLEILQPGWSVYVREERKKFFTVLPISQSFNSEGYASLPFDSVPQEARASHLFVSYVYYKDKLADGDNFIYEARLRNSVKEHAVPLSDIIMYISSDTHQHGFAMNDNGYAYFKFISGEKTIKGDEYNLSRFNFNASVWHVMAIKVVNKKTTFYVDGEEVLGMDYNEPLGLANELILRFKGCGAVDYVKISKLDGEVVFEENFDRMLP